MRKKYRQALHLSRWAEQAGISVPQACELLDRCDTAFKAGERYANRGLEKDAGAEQRAGRRVELYAEIPCGLRTQWPGLWPTFETADGRTIYLPSL